VRRPDDLNAGAIAVVIDPLRDAVAVRVKERRYEPGPFDV